MVLGEWWIIGTAPLRITKGLGDPGHVRITRDKHQKRTFIPISTAFLHMYYTSKNMAEKHENFKKSS